MEHIATMILRKCPVAQKDLTSKGTPTRCQVGLLKTKVLQNIVNRYPAFKADLEIFLHPLMFHRKYPPTATNPEDGGNVAVQEQAVLPHIPTFAHQNQDWEQEERHKHFKRPKSTAR